jgi:hypothetical protein
MSLFSFYRELLIPFFLGTNAVTLYSPTIFPWMASCPWLRLMIMVLQSPDLLNHPRFMPSPYLTPLHTLPCICIINCNYSFFLPASVPSTTFSRRRFNPRGIIFKFLMFLTGGEILYFFQ